MTASPLIRIIVCFTALLLFGCSVVRDSVVDHAAGFPAAHVIKDVRSASSEHEEEQHEKRVEELNSEYEEFIRSKEDGDKTPSDPKSSVIMKNPESADSE